MAVFTNSSIGSSNYNSFTIKSGIRWPRAEHISEDERKRINVTWMQLLLSYYSTWFLYGRWFDMTNNFTCSVEKCSNIILRFCQVMSGLFSIQTIWHIFIIWNLFALLPVFLLSVKCCSITCYNCAEEVKQRLNIIYDSTSIKHLKYNIYISVHTLELAFYDDLYPDTKIWVHKLSIRQKQSDQNSRTVTSGRSQMMYKED